MNENKAGRVRCYNCYWHRTRRCSVKFKNSRDCLHCENYSIQKGFWLDGTVRRFPSNNELRNAKRYIPEKENRRCETCSRYVPVYVEGVRSMRCALSKCRNLSGDEFYD
jgi:hypothetical protein